MHLRDLNRFIKRILNGETYFGPELAALQGPPERHRFFRPTAEKVCKKFDDPIRILEIGSWAGASTITWAKAFLELDRSVTIDCVDQWMPYFDLSRETDLHYRQMNEAAESQSIYRLFLHNLQAEGIADLVNVKRGQSQDVLPKLSDNTYHLIYIDASHFYADVVRDVREAKRLILDGGIICGDDLEIQADELPSQALLQAVETGLDYTKCDIDERFFHPGVTAAVAEELGPVSVWQGYWAIRFVSGQTENIVLDLASTNLPAHIQHAIDEVPSSQLIEEDGRFRILEVGNRYIAVAMPLDPKQIVESVSFDFDIPPIVFIADSILELRKKLGDVKHTGVIASFDNKHIDRPTLIGAFEGFNLVLFEGKIIGIHKSSGSINVRIGIPSLLNQLGPNRIVISANEDEVFVGIALRKWLGETEARQVDSLALLQQQLKEAEATQKRYAEESEARQAESVTLLQQQLKEAEATQKRYAEESEARQAEAIDLLKQEVEECVSRLDVISQSTVGKILFKKLNQY